MATAEVDARLSTSADDMVNTREKFRSRSNSMRLADGPKAKPVKTGGCFSWLCGRKPEPIEADVVLIGAGIMSATVGLMLKQLQPDWKIMMIERLGSAAEESSNGFNNAGTGHAGFMEPNYTKEVEKDGVKTVTSEKIVTICEQFMLSRQYWANLADKHLIGDPDAFIHHSDHIALGIGEDQVEFIKKRYEVMKKLPLFESIELALDKETQSKWAPLVWEGRDSSDKVAMTRIKFGTDVDFGALAKEKVKAFTKLGGDLRLFTQVTNVKKQKDGKWLLTTKSNSVQKKSEIKAKFVFVGAGGWALHMLQASKIPEIKGYMALPVTGDWAVCQNPKVVEKHKVKVYAPGAPGAPPMSMPHLDFRTIGGKEMLLFGPFGSITFKFLRYGSVLDALKAVKPHNLLPTAAVMMCEAPDLVIMLMKDVFKSGAGRIEDIRHYYPEADPADWSFTPAGVRAQIIKKDPKKVGTLQFGTEVVANKEGTIVGLLGASPGASICVSTALDVLKKCFSDSKQWPSASGGSLYDSWQPKLKEMIPSYGTKLNESASACAQIYQKTGASLKIS